MRRPATLWPADGVHTHAMSGKKAQLIQSNGAKAAEQIDQISHELRSLEEAMQKSFPLSDQEAKDLRERMNAQFIATQSSEASALA